MVPSRLKPKRLFATSTILNLTGIVATVRWSTMSISQSKQENTLRISAFCMMEKMTRYSLQKYVLLSLTIYLPGQEK